ncbi:hypothetical protein BGX28_001782 [Mortierella sp. GBA30]|nr:hypothetical protein BGX28_001782 [Mortierella sp. GBA30]
MKIEAKAAALKRDVEERELNVVQLQREVKEAAEIACRDHDELQDGIFELKKMLTEMQRREMDLVEMKKVDDQFSGMTLEGAQALLVGQTQQLQSLHQELDELNAEMEDLKWQESQLKDSNELLISQRIQVEARAKEAISMSTHRSPELEAAYKECLEATKVYQERVGLESIQYLTDSSSLILEYKITPGSAIIHTANPTLAAKAATTRAARSRKPILTQFLIKIHPTSGRLLSASIENTGCDFSSPERKSSTLSLWKKVAIAGTIAVATSATLLNQTIKKTSQMEANIAGSTSSLSTLAGQSVIEDLKDEHSRIAVENKPTSELILSLLVYKMCTFGLLVDLAPKLIHMAEKMHLTVPVYWIVRKTFFAQFCGGETAEECIDTMAAFWTAGIKTILDLSIEADLDESDMKTQTPEEIRARYNKSADSVAGQTSTCIETASHTPQSFVAVKLTAMASPLLLHQVSNTLTAIKRSFKNIVHESDGKITKVEFRELVEMLPNATEQEEALDTLVEQLFNEADKDCDGRVDWVDISSTISLSRDETRTLFIAKDPVRTQTVVIPGLIKEDLEDYHRLLSRMRKLCDQAQKTQTRLMIDAEQTYFQPSIDDVALYLQEQYNRAPHEDGPLIYNTYQMYLKDALERLSQDYTRAQRNGYAFAVKMVRGAYMIGERQRASELGLEDPICDGVEATHVSFNAGVDFMLDVMGHRLKQEQDKEKDDNNEDKDRKEEILPLSLNSSPVVLCVASHNKDSVIRTCERMQDIGLSPQSGLVMFGQLKGMCDQMSYTLGQHGYGVYKYVPYGRIHDVIPYLVRRAQENMSVLGGVVVEQNLLWEELKQRCASSYPFRTRCLTSGPGTAI